ncbi:MAG: ribosome-binding factor A [Candidatus Pacebacteria bacterium]|nr:ribosome-binding factor A [Candidatus Paceibacterota bacterium]
MEFDRHNRVAGLLGEIVAEFVRNEASSNPLITVTKVTVSKDYKRATVFVTTIPDSGEDDALVFLKRKGSDIRDFVKKKKLTLRHIPHFDFEIDRGERHRQHMDELVHEIHEQKE